MKELNLAELCSMYEMLGDPNRWKHNIENGILKNGIDNSTDCYISQNGIDYLFKIKHINKYEVEWRPKEKIIISNSDEESFSEGALIAAFDKDHNPMPQEEIDAYNKLNGLE